MRYAILSDIHGNLPALEAVLRDMEAEATAEPIGAIFFLGDAIGYYADSSAVVARLHQRLKPLSARHRVNGRWQSGKVLPWLAGNHEWGLIGRIPEEYFGQQALITLRQTQQDLSNRTQAWLGSLPEWLELELADGLRATLLHAAPHDPVGATGAGYVENSADASKAAQGLNTETQICIVGHTHYPRICYEHTSYDGPKWEVVPAFMLPNALYQFRHERLILNPGSVGQPRDGEPLAAYAILDTRARTFRVRRVPYDIAETQARTRAWLREVSSRSPKNEKTIERLLTRLKLGI